jgi:hypothetical protein
LKTLVPIGAIQNTGEPNVIVTSPHKVYGPESNDLALQLRKHGFDSVLAGMSASMYRII